MSKVKNTLGMLEKEGVGPFLHKIGRLCFHKTRALARKIFYSGTGKKLREQAKKYFSDKDPRFKLSIVIPVLGQHDVTRLCLNKIAENRMKDVEILIIDNGGDFDINEDLINKTENIKVFRPSKENTGVYPTFKSGMENTIGDIVLFIHSDMIIDEYGFDVLLRYVFAIDDNLGLVGFIGSDEMNDNGGRGWGTTSNFLGKTYKYKDRVWSGTDYSIHGEYYDGLSPAVVLDGCSMAIRRSVWNKIGYRENRPLHHYYDKLISLQVLEAGYKDNVLGIACDHISGQTAYNEKKYNNTAEEWCRKNNVPQVKDASGNVNWDMSMHDEAKRLFLKEWRDEKHFIPKVINK